MDSNAIIQIGLFSFIIIVTSVPPGLYMAKVFAREHTFKDGVFAPAERLICRSCRIHPTAEQTSVGYAGLESYGDPLKSPGSFRISSRTPSATRPTAAQLKVPPISSALTCCYLSWIPLRAFRATSLRLCLSATMIVCPADSRILQEVSALLSSTRSSKLMTVE